MVLDMLQEEASRLEKVLKSSKIDLVLGDGKA
jgi:hypothetical protein